jgi:endonuclease/exonuclease/phosphatase family metal-dependent hydrolase
VERRTWSDDRFIVLGDMNDPPDSPCLEPMVVFPDLGLVNALSDPKETREPKAEKTGPGPQTTAWTYRHKESGEAPVFHLYDQIWLSPSLFQGLQNAWIDRRTRHGGDGSDHDPAWIEIEL